MAIKRERFELPLRRRGRRRSVFLGENNTDAPTDDVFQQGFFPRLRNYQLGRRGLLKRQGIRRFTSGPNRVAAGRINGMGIHDSDETRKLLVACGAGLYQLDGESWTDRSGAFAFDPDHTMRFTEYHRADTSWLIGTNGVDKPWKWDGTGDIEELGPAMRTNPDSTDTDNPTIDNPIPTRARAVAEFQGRLWWLNTNNGETLLEYSDDGTEEEYRPGQYLICSARSEGMALAVFGDASLLVFHRDSIHRVYFHYAEALNYPSPFARDPVDSNRGCYAVDSVVVHRGSCFFADRDGIYEVNGVDRRARKVSRPLDAFWEELPADRIAEIKAFPIGERGEICFLVTSLNTGSLDAHDMAMVYNVEWAKAFGHEAGWTIFRINNITCRATTGLWYPNEQNQPVNLLGAPDGYLYEAWGNDRYSTGPTDVGQPVSTEWKTGFLDMDIGGYEKGLRAFSIDLLAPPGERLFRVEIYAEQARLAYLAEQRQVGSEAASSRLGDFILGESMLAGPLEPEEIVFDVAGSGRYFETSLQESSTGDPHALMRTRWQFRRERQVD